MINDDKEGAAVTVSMAKALASFATHADTVFELFGLYCKASDLELKQAAKISKSKPEVSIDTINGVFPP